MATMILIEKADVKEIADVYSKRLMKQAELAAKKELVSIATAIDAAAAKGNYELSYRLSGSITRLTGSYLATAMEIIAADITAAAYTSVTPEYKKGTEVVIGYTFNWGVAAPVEEPSGGEPTGEQSQGGNNTQEPTQQEPQQPETPTVSQNDEDYDVVTSDEIAELGAGEGPVSEGWYEKNEGVYALSDDDEVVNEVTYYKAKASE